MLVTMKEILDRASRGMYGVPAPNVGGEREARAALMVAEEMNSPMIFDVAYKNHPDIPFFGSYLSRLCEQSKIPVAINLDHGSPDEDMRLVQPMLAVKAGFTSLMVDRSAWPYEENVKEVQLIAQLAHAAGMSVEAELGRVGQGQSYENDGTAHLTDPDQAKDYIERTGIDCLAVSVGTAHGAYAGTPKIDFERLAAIKEKTNGFPLVLHGGSGSGDENLKKACELGINKVNVSNELQAAGGRAVQQMDISGNGAYKVWATMVEAWAARLRFLIGNFGCAGKAWQVQPKGVGNAKISYVED
ncbi:MAG: class II fructose-bisphosphate aldolase [Christensenellaceae bacterium]|jgi:fructose-bisphosphate aldolase class II